MDDSELTTIITNKSTILRLLTEILEQSLPLTISSEGKEPRVYRSSILKVESENNQLILHQLLSTNSPNAHKSLEDIEVTCHSQYGRIKFSGKITPLDDSDNALYSCLTFPAELTKEQLRSSFRVPLNQFNSTTSLKLEEGDKFVGTCKDISMAGALFCLPVSDKNIKLGEQIEHCQLVIVDILALSCPAKICHVKVTPDNNLLVGLQFLDLEIAQVNSIRPAMKKLERLNILQQKTSKRPLPQH